MRRHIIKTIACIAAAFAVAGCSHTPTRNDSQQVAVNITRDGALTVAGESCSESELAARLKARVAQRPTAVLIRADAETPAKYMTAVAEACRTAAVQKVMLAAPQ